MGFSIELRRLRLEKNILQKDLAQIIGTSVQQVSRLETGESEPTIKHLLKLADYFGCTIDYLVGRESEDGIINIQNYNIEKSEIQTLFDKLDRFEKERVLGYVRALVAMKDTGAGNQAN